MRSPTSKHPSPPPLDGELRFDDQARAAAADDFGHLVHRTPGGVLLPGRSRTWRPRCRGAVSRSGVLSDNVLELEVVTGRGERLDCSPVSHPRLFDAVRAGLGQVAVVTRATLRLVPAPRQVRRFLLHYRDLATMLGDQRLLTREHRFERVQGAVLPAPDGGWACQLDVVKELSGISPDDATLLADLSDDRPRAEPATMPYLGDAVVESVVTAELARLAPADLGPMGQVLVSPVLRESVRTPMLRLPPEPVCFTFNVMRFPPTDDAAQAGRLVMATRRSTSGSGTPAGRCTRSAPSRCRRPAGAPTWGVAFTQLSEAKQEHDPGQVLTPGYEVFAQVRGRITWNG